MITRTLSLVNQQNHEDIYTRNSNSNGNSDNNIISDSNSDNNAYYHSTEYDKYEMNHHNRSKIDSQSHFEYLFMILKMFPTYFKYFNIILISFFDLLSFEMISYLAVFTPKGDYSAYVVNKHSLRSNAMHKHRILSMRECEYRLLL